MPLCLKFFHFFSFFLSKTVFRSPSLAFRNLFFLVLFLAATSLSAQPGSALLAYQTADPLDSLADQHFLKPATSFNGRRFRIAAGTGLLLYSGASYGLWQTWYANYPRSSFQTINDLPEWLQMDKPGHAFTAYQYARFAFAGARWTGMSRPNARYTAIGVSTLLQTTLEVFDGFSAQWGFSWSDIAANTVGTGLFIAQDLVWREQRVLFKVSSNLRPIPDIPITNGNGAEGNVGDVVRLRYGSGLIERYLKDYNNQTIWLSANLRSFSPQARALPPWLNVAVGYGAENVYGAYGNTWRIGEQSFSYNAPRYRQWFLSPDIYFSRIPTQKRWLRLVLGALDFFKLPAPTLEYSQGTFKGRWLMW